MSYGTLQIEKMTTESGYSLGAGNASSFKNRIINGGMAVFQRGTAATTDQGFSVDRWKLVKSNDATESVSQSTDAPTGFSYSLRNTVATGDATIAAVQYSGFEQPIEGYNITDLMWGTANAKPITLSFWVRSSVTGTYTGNVRNNNDTRINPFNFTINAANTWEQKIINVTGDTGGTWQTTTSTGIIVAIYAALGSNYTGGTAGTWGTTPAFGCGSPVNGIASNGNIFAISGVQLEVGTVATSFDFRSYGTELALCQRYLPAFYGSYNYFTGIANSRTQAYVFVPFQVPARVAPTGVVVNAASAFNVTDITTQNAAASAISLNVGAINGAQIIATCTGLTASRCTQVFSNSSTSNIYFTGCEL